LSQKKAAEIPIVKLKNECLTASVNKTKLFGGIYDYKNEIHRRGNTWIESQES